MRALTILCYTAWDWTADVGGCSQACYPSVLRGLYLRSVPQCHDWPLVVHWPCRHIHLQRSVFHRNILHREQTNCPASVSMQATNHSFFSFLYLRQLGFVFLVLLRCPLGSVSRFSLEQLWWGRWAEIHVSVGGLIIHHRKEWIIRYCMRRSCSLQTRKFDPLHWNLKYSRTCFRWTLGTAKRGQCSFKMMSRAGY